MLGPTNAKDRNKRSLFHEAALYGTSEIVKHLIGADANFNVKDHDENTPLLKAYGTSSPNIVKLLFDSGADANVKD